MRKNRGLAVLGGAATVAIAIALAPNAQAACAWNGYGWACDQGGPQQQVANSPLPSVPPGSNWGTDRYTPQGYNYNNYDQIPNDYPGPALTTPNGRGGGGGGGRQ
ncbi:MAG TPA: hypothetical protein VHW66_01925 [Stellaceae bacterium]|nr:hypothetical protein [Stellaceae bacterium]